MMQDQRGSGIPSDNGASTESTPVENHPGVKNVSPEEFAAGSAGTEPAAQGNPPVSTKYQVGGFIDLTDPAFVQQQPMAPVVMDRQVSDPAAPVVLLQTGEETTAPSESPSSTDATQAETAKQPPAGEVRSTEAATTAAAAKKQKTKPTKNTAKAKKRGLSSNVRNSGLRRIVIILIVAFVVFDIIVVAYLFFLSRGEPPVYYSQPTTVIEKYASAEGNIPIIQYDEDLDMLSFSNYPNLTIANTASLKLIDNNKYRPFGGPNGTPLFYDDLIINRVLQLNYDWVDYLNNGDSAVFDSVMGSTAETKINEWGAGYQVAYHRLAFGELRHVGNDYLIVTQPYYTLAGGGTLESQDVVIIFKLRASGSTMKVIDMEILPFTPQNTATSTTPDPGSNDSVTGSAPTSETQGSNATASPGAEGDGENATGGTTPESTPTG